MLTKNDELFCHQIVSTFDRPGTSAREWMERAWMMTFETSGKLHWGGGMGYNPNRNTIDAFGVFWIEDKTQYYVRASRELRPNIDQAKVGPFSYEVVKPLKKVRLVLDENEYGLSFDVEIDGTSPPFEEDGGQYQVVRGRVKEDIWRFLQSGKPSGWIKADGKTYQIDKDKWWGIRDRSWGIRIGMGESLETGVQPPERSEGGLYHFAVMQFENWGARYQMRGTWDSNLNMPRVWHFSGGMFYPYGSGKEGIPLGSIEHDFQFGEDSFGIKRFESGRVILNAIDGSKKEISIRVVSVYHPNTAGYGVYKGYVSGLWMGPSWIDGGKLDLTDPDVRREVWAGYHGYGAEFRCGNEVGYGTVDVSVSGKYPPTGIAAKQ